MSKSIIDYLSDNNTADENFKNSLALDQGIHAGLIFLTKRIKSYHDLIELEVDNESPAGLYLQESQSAIKKANEILGFLASMSPDEMHDFESIDMTILINAIVKRVNKISKFNVSTHLDAISDNDAFISGNLFLLQQLFFDLLYIINDNNTDITSELSIECHLEKIDEDSPNNLKTILDPGEFLQITITNQKDASTVSSKNLVSVFDSLSQSSRSFDGRLLYIYGVIKQHKGDMLMSRSHASNIVCVAYLPLLQNSVSMYTEKNINEADLKGSETILLVDDEDIIWDVVIDMLQNMGYVVILAADGKECVEIYKENPGQIDIVLLDMVMPEMNGHDAFFALKEIDADVKVLLSSGYVKEEDARDVLNAGAAGFLQKPYRMIELAQKIKQIISN